MDRHAAFKTQIALLMGRLWFTPVWFHFDELLFSKTSEFLRTFVNSMIVGAGSTVLVLVVATLGAYSIYRMRWPAMAVHALLLWSTIFHMIPPITLAGAWYVMFRSIGLDNTHLGLVLAHTTLNLPMALWLMAVFVREVPRELEDAARVDGATTPRVLWHIILPLVLPGLMATGILVFVFSWNEFAVALSLTQKATQTVPVGIAKYAQDYEIKYNEMAAAAILSTVPAIILLLIGQRYIVRGLTAGAVK